MLRQTLRESEHIRSSVEREQHDRCRKFWCAPKALHARAGRAGSVNSRMPGNMSRSADFGRIRSRSAKEMEAYKELTEQARAFRGRQRGRPSATVRACANESLQSRAEGAARPYTKVYRAHGASRT